MEKLSDLDLFGEKGLCPNWLYIVHFRKTVCMEVERIVLHRVAGLLFCCFSLVGLLTFLQILLVLTHTVCSCVHTQEEVFVGRSKIASGVIGVMPES